MSNSVHATPNAAIAGRGSVPERIRFSCSPPIWRGRIRTPFFMYKAPQPFGA